MSANDFYTDQGAGACAVHLVDSAGLGALLGKMTDAHRSWVRSTGWEAKPGAVLYDVKYVLPADQSDDRL